MAFLNLRIILSYPLAELFEYLFMFWLDRHLLAKKALNSEQSVNGYERIIQEILRQSGYSSDNDIFTLVSPAVFLINKVYFPLSSSDTLVILRVVVYPSPPSSSSSTVMITLSPNKQKCKQKLRKCKQTPKYKQTQLNKITISFNFFSFQ